MSKPLVPLEDLFPNAFCWIAHPKESSFNYIKKYLGNHYKHLDVEGKAFRNVSNPSHMHFAVPAIEITTNTLVVARAPGLG